MSVAAADVQVSIDQSIGRGHSMDQEASTLQPIPTLLQIKVSPLSQCLYSARPPSDTFFMI